MSSSGRETAPERVAEMQADARRPDLPDETARSHIAAMLAERNELDARDVRYRKLVAEYGGNRHARRRARAEVRKKGA